MARLVIRDCSVLVVPVEGECRVDEYQDILIVDGVIAEVMPAGAIVAEGGVEEVDASGLIAVPGLVNSHTHSPMVMMRGAAEDVSIDDWFNRKIWPMEMNLTPERVKAGARLACAEMLPAGVTTFVDHYFHADQIAAAALETGIRADLAPTFFSSNSFRLPAKTDHRYPPARARRGIPELPAVPQTSPFSRDCPAWKRRGAGCGSLSRLRKTEWTRHTAPRRRQGDRAGERRLTSHPDGSTRRVRL